MVRRTKKPQAKAMSFGKTLLSETGIEREINSFLEYLVEKFDLNRNDVFMAMREYKSSGSRVRDSRAPAAASYDGPGRRRNPSESGGPGYRVDESAAGIQKVEGVTVQSSGIVIDNTGVRMRGGNGGATVGYFEGPVMHSAKDPSRNMAPPFLTSHGAPHLEKRAQKQVRAEESDSDSGHASDSGRESGSGREKKSTEAVVTKDEGQPESSRIAPRQKSASQAVRGAKDKAGAAPVPATSAKAKADALKAKAEEKRKAAEEKKKKEEEKKKIPPVVTISRVVSKDGDRYSTKCDEEFAKGVTNKVFAGLLKRKTLSEDEYNHLKNFLFKQKIPFTDAPQKAVITTGPAIDKKIQDILKKAEKEMREKDGDEEGEEASGGSDDDKDGSGSEKNGESDDEASDSGLDEEESKEEKPKSTANAKTQAKDAAKTKAKDAAKAKVTQAKDAAKESASTNTTKFKLVKITTNTAWDKDSKYIFRLNRNKEGKLIPIAFAMRVEREAENQPLTPEHVEDLKSRGLSYDLSFSNE